MSSSTDLHTPRKLARNDGSSDSDEVVIEPKRRKLATNAEKLHALNQISTLSSSAEEKIERASFTHYREVIEEGDLVIVYVEDGMYKPIHVKRGKSLDMKKGNLRHDYLLGKCYGSKIKTTAGYVYPLRPNPVLWSRCLTRHTQILYQHDIATIISLLEIAPGFVIAESGTGSGSLTHALAVAVGREGHVYTHEKEEKRAKAVEKNFYDHALNDRVTVVVANVYEEGFFIKNSCDGIFLDLPEPWKAITHCKNAMSQMRGGNLVSFSPCIEQVVRTIEELKRQDFHLIETIEVVPTQFKVARKNQKRIPFKKDAKLEKSMSAPVPPSKEKQPQPSAEEDKPAPVNKESTSDELDIVSPETEELSLTNSEDTPPKEPVNNKHFLVPKAVKQPTHSGYLVYAKMFPGVYVDKEE